MNFGDLYDYVDEQLSPDTVVLIEEDEEGTGRVFTSGQMRDSSNNLARQLIAMGGEPGDKVAIYSKNRAEYIQALIAVFKARLVHVNVNFRYGPQELQYLLENSDARFVVFESDYADNVNAIRPQLPLVKQFIEICDEDKPAFDWAASFNELSETGSGEKLQIERSPEDQIFLYTGGTTGMPKAAMWEQYNLWNMIGVNQKNPEMPSPQLPEELALRPEGGGANALVIMPLMHGAGLYTVINALGYGNTCVLLRTRSFDAGVALRCIEKHGIAAITIAGDAFAQPIIKAMDVAQGAFSLASLRFVISSAMIFSPHNKKALLKHCPEITIVDNMASSESSTSAYARSNSDSSLEDGAVKMQLAPNAKVFTKDLKEVQAGSGETGFLAISGTLPLGYYKDEQKTAETFITVDGLRYSIPGDWVELHADSSLTFLGRGNVCINSAGEKIYPDEIEATLKSHDLVDDCLVVGVPDERWGQAVTAVVQLAADRQVEADTLREHVRQFVAGYKVPKHVLYVDKVFRGANGKADYQATKALAEKELS
ncbi:AMP-binding protein [Candidatus Litorirhabdus singularis]|nr:AMP-binding protein [Candidatus Litorirhabdus singularis]